MLIGILAFIMTICYMFVMYGNPFREHLTAHIQKNTGGGLRGIKVLQYNDDFKYFFEFPLGISGVIYNKKLYFFDKTSMTVCAPIIYESVFNYKNKKFISMCFLSERVIRGIFSHALHSETFIISAKSFKEKVEEISFRLMKSR